MARFHVMNSTSNLQSP
uniref:Uncharacterized protein n=1 Tax=Arundo donax TaxID=35708 RepID=A0A0A9FQP7_ARUDO